MDQVHAMNLAMARKAARLTQAEVARKLGVGQAAVSRLEGREDMLLSALYDSTGADNASIVTPSTAAESNSASRRCTARAPEHLALPVTAAIRRTGQFDTSGRPPAGWMHALFDGGPFAEDVGRCVPGPPPPDPLVMGNTTYMLRTVGSWSDPHNPIAIYGLRGARARQ